MPHLLLILDGYGLATDANVSAVDAADTPYLDSLFAQHPHGTLEASERAVGLPVGQMGNSEVGHTNLGAGRVVHQDIVRIDVSIEDESFYSNSALVEAAGHVKQTGGRLHLLGLFSDGGVHSHLDHLYALLRMAERNGIGDRTLRPRLYGRPRHRAGRSRKPLRSRGPSADARHRCRTDR